MPTDDVKQFISELLGMPDWAVKVGYSEPIATWMVEIARGRQEDVANTQTHGTPRYWAHELIQDALNGKVPTVYDKDAEGKRYVNDAETEAAREKQNDIKIEALEAAILATKAEKGSRLQLVRRYADIAFRALKTSVRERKTALRPAFRQRAGFLTPRND